MEKILQKIFQTLGFLILLLVLALTIGRLIVGKNNNSIINDNQQSSSNPPAVIEYSNCSNQDISLNLPALNSTVTSPLDIIGQAKGNWFFEGSFPIIITDANGTKLGQTTAQAQDDWTTANSVTFKASLKFAADQTTTSQGWLILQNDNPSGDPKLAARLHYPINLK